MDAALHADFCGPSVPGLCRPPGDFPVGQQVRRPPKLLCYAALAERAEAACVRTPICVVYVPADPTKRLAPKQLNVDIIACTAQQSSRQYIQPM